MPLIDDFACFGVVPTPEAEWRLGDERQPAGLTGHDWRAMQR
jgi:hypothetical protein